MRKRLNVFIILLLAVLTIFGSIECAYAADPTLKEGSAVSTKFICKDGTLPVTWHGYIWCKSQWGRTSEYSDPQYSRFRVTSAGIYVTKTAVWSSGKNKGHKQSIDIPHYKYISCSFSGATPKAVKDGSKNKAEYASKKDPTTQADSKNAWKFSVKDQDDNIRHKMTGGAGGSRNYYFQKGSGTKNTPVTCTWKVYKKPGKTAYKNADGSYQGTSSGKTTFSIPPAEVKIQYNANGAGADKIVKDSKGSVTQTWTTNSSGMILKNGSIVSSTGYYGAKVSDTDGLMNHSSYLSAGNNRKGYYLISGKEWNSKADGTGTSYGMDDTGITYASLAKSNTSTVKDMTVTVYANWHPNKYTINYNSNKGTGTMDAQSVTYDSEDKILQNKFKRSGYAFVGWNTKADGTGTDYKAGDSASMDVINGGSTTLYAQWRQIDHVSLRYNVDYGSLSTDLSKKGYNLNANWIIRNDIPYQPYIPNLNTGVKIFPGEDKTYEKGDIYRFGYSLPKGAEWVDKNTGMTYAAGETYYCDDFGSENVTLTANWKANKGSLTIDPGSGFFDDGTDEPIVYNNPGVQQATSNWCDIRSIASTISKANYTLTGFYDKDGVRVYDARGYCDNNSPYWKSNMYQKEGSLYVTARYEENTAYTVNYNKNDPSATGTMKSSPIYVESAGKLRPNSFEKEGYKFVGWNTKPDGSGNAYEDEDEMPTEFLVENEDGTSSSLTNVTLYAQWRVCNPPRYDTASVMIPNTPNDTIPDLDHVMVEVRKIDEDTGKALPGAEFELRDKKTGTAYKGVSNADGIVIFDGITELNSEKGMNYEYEIVETKPPKNYTASTGANSNIPCRIVVTREYDDAEDPDSYLLNVNIYDKNGKEITATPIEDDTNIVTLRIVGRNKSTLKTLKLTKKSSGTNEILPGVVFSLSGNGYYKENKTDISGVLRFSDLENGTYTLTEKKTTAGHILPGKAWTVTVSDSGINIS